MPIEEQRQAPGMMYQIPYVPCPICGLPLVVRHDKVRVCMTKKEGEYCKGTFPARRAEDMNIVNVQDKGWLI
jgi:hypothetical protein